MKNVKRKESSKNNRLSEKKMTDAMRLRRFRLVCAVLLNNLTTIENSKALAPHAEKFLDETLDAYTRHYELKRSVHYTIKPTLVIALGQAYELDGHSRDKKIDGIIKQIDEWKLNKKPISNEARERLKRKQIYGRGQRSGRQLAIENIPLLFDQYSKSTFERDYTRMKKNVSGKPDTHFVEEMSIGNAFEVILKKIFGFNGEQIARFKNLAVQLGVWESTQGSERPINNEQAAINELRAITLIELTLTNPPVSKRKHLTSVYGRLY